MITVARITPLARPSGCPFRTRCPIARPACAEARPPLIDAGGGHLVACPYYEEMGDLGAT